MARRTCKGCVYMYACGDLKKTTPCAGRHTADDRKTCIICGKPYEEWGNNPWPVKDHGECCDACNAEFVIPARIRMLAKEAGHGSV